MIKRPALILPRPTKIERLSVAVVSNGEGELVYGAKVEDGGNLPIVAIDDVGIFFLKHYAQAEANISGASVRIISFTERSLHDTVRPFATGDKENV